MQAALGEAVLTEARPKPEEYDKPQPPCSWEDMQTNTSTSNTHHLREARKTQGGTLLTHILKPELLITIQPS